MTQGLPGSTGHRARNRATHVEVNILAVLDAGSTPAHSTSLAGALNGSRFSLT